MRIRWFGQSAFLLAGAEHSVFVDPFGDVSILAQRGMRFDYPPIENVTADLVLITHEHFDHNAVDVVYGSPHVIRSTAGRFDSPAGEVLAVASEHDDVAGTARGPNTIFCISVDGLRVCHLGDFGQPALRPDQREALGEVDVLLCPIGGATAPPRSTGSTRPTSSSTRSAGASTAPRWRDRRRRAARDARGADGRAARATGLDRTAFRLPSHGYVFRPSVKHLFANHDLATSRCGELIDVTEDLRAVVAESGVANGMALVYSPHTTCAIAINELEDGFLEDFAEALCALAPEGRYYRHDDRDRRAQELDPDTAELPNGHSHVRAGLLAASSQTIPIVDGSLMLGRWQRVFLCELDRARQRKVFMQVLGD